MKSLGLSPLVLLTIYLEPFSLEAQVPNDPGSGCIEAQAAIATGARQELPLNGRWIELPEAEVTKYFNARIATGPFEGQIAQQVKTTGTLKFKVPVNGEKAVMLETQTANRRGLGFRDTVVLTEGESTSLIQADPQLQTDRTLSGSVMGAPVMLKPESFLLSSTDLSQEGTSSFRIFRFLDDGRFVAHTLDLLSDNAYLAGPVQLLERNGSRFRLMLPVHNRTRSELFFREVELHLVNRGSRGMEIRIIRLDSPQEPLALAHIRNQMETQNPDSTSLRSASARVKADRISRHNYYYYGSPNFHLSAHPSNPLLFGFVGQLPDRSRFVVGIISFEQPGEPKLLSFGTLPERLPRDFRFAQVQRRDMANGLASPYLVTGRNPTKAGSDDPLLLAPGWLSDAEFGIPYFGLRTDSREAHIGLTNADGNYPAFVVQVEEAR